MNGCAILHFRVPTVCTCACMHACTVVYFHAQGKHYIVVAMCGLSQHATTSLCSVPENSLLVPPRRCTEWTWSRKSCFRIRSGFFPLPGAFKMQEGAEFQKLSCLRSELLVLMESLFAAAGPGLITPPSLLVWLTLHKREVRSGAILPPLIPLRKIRFITLFNV